MSLASSRLSDRSLNIAPLIVLGGAVVFDTNELLKLFANLRVVRYEDTTAVAGSGRSETWVVRLAAVKPRPAVRHDESLLTRAWIQWVTSSFPR